MKLYLSEQKVNDKNGLEIVLVRSKKLKNDTKKLKLLGYKGELESAIILQQEQKLYTGCEECKKDDIAVAFATAIKTLKNTEYKTAYIEASKDIDKIVEGLELGAYSFTKYKSKKDKKDKKTITIVVPKITKQIQDDFNKATIIANSMNMVRDFINTTPEDFTPDSFAKEAKRLAKEDNLEIKVYSEDYFKKEGMGAISAVGRASRHDSKIVHLTYKPKKPIAKVVFVGKGLTYDSGGLSLKPSDFMTTMKSDKSGASAVFGIVSAAAKLNLNIEVHGVVGAVENMIGGDAYKPDDVLVAKNGSTIEVRNTDAEGRLVLADVLCYAQDEIKDIDYIIDYATLTGACVVGIGEYTSGVMGNNVMLNHKMVQAALDSGELATTLPFNRYLKKTIKSEIADICNISSTRYGGAITAGLFLEHFIKDENKKKWLHIDIAGPAYVEKAWGYNPYGASGAGVRMGIKFLENLNG